jgi:predicted nucleic acid-binding protein
MPGVVFDINIWIAYKPTKLPNNPVMSAVVLLELVAGASDGAVLKGLEASRKQYEKEDKLLIPTGEDWFRAGKILNSFLRNLKTQSGGKTPRLQPNKIQQMFRDTLLAVSVRRTHALLVTDNVSDFQAIQRYGKLRIQSGRAFFAR